MTSVPLLSPRDPRRMKQPTKAILRQCLELAAAEIERLTTIVLAVEDALNPKPVEIHAEADTNE